MEHVFTRDPRRPKTDLTKKRKPDWAFDPALMLSKEDVEKFNSTEFSTAPRFGYDGKNFEAVIVYRGDGDIIYQLFKVRHGDFRQLLAEVVEAHFSSTDDFAVDFMKEVLSWGLIARGVRTRPLFNEQHYTGKFLDLLDQVLEEAVGAH